MPLYRTQYNQIVKGFQANAKANANATPADASLSVSKSKMPQAHKDLLHRALNFINSAGEVAGSIQAKALPELGSQVERIPTLARFAKPVLPHAADVAIEKGIVKPTRQFSDKTLGKVANSPQLAPNPAITNKSKIGAKVGAGIGTADVILGEAAAPTPKITALVKGAQRGKQVKGLSDALGQVATGGAKTAARNTRVGGAIVKQATKPETNPARLLGTAQMNAATRIRNIDSELHDLSSRGVGSKFTPTRDMSGTPTQLTPAKFEKNLKGGNLVVAKGKTATFSSEKGTFSASEHVNRWRSLMDERKALIDRLHSEDRPPTPEKVAAKVSIPEHVATPSKAPVSAVSAEKTLENAGQMGGKELGFLRSTFGSKGTVLKGLGDAGGSIAHDILKIDRHSGDLFAHYLRQLPTYKKLSDKESAMVHDVIKNGAVPTTDKVAKAANEAKAVLSQVEADAGRAGVQVAHRQNYMPQIHTRESLDAIKKNPQEAKDYLVSSGQAKDLKEATQKLNAYLYRTGDVGKGETYGNLERSRVLDLPGYRTDKNALLQYLDKSSQRVAQATHFGPQNEKVAAKIEHVGLQGGDTNVAKEAIKNYLRSPAGGGKGGRALNAVRSAYAVARLPYAALAHSTQTSNTAELVGATRTARAWLQTGFSKSARDFADKAGVASERELHGIAEQVTGVTGKLGKGIAPGLTPVMKANRYASAIAGRDYGRFLARTVSKGGKKGDKALSVLRKYGVEGDIKNGALTQDQEYRIARGITDEAIFNRSRGGTPVWAETQLGRTAGQYRLSYAYKQTRHTYENVIKEAGRGNLMPLARRLAIAAPLTYATRELRAKTSGNDRQGAGGKALDVIGALGGLPGELAVQAARYGKKDVGRYVFGSAAPLAGEVYDASKALTDSIKQKAIAPVGRYVTGTIPFRGRNIAASEFPYGDPSGRAVKQYASKDLNQELTRLKYTIKDPSTTNKRTSSLNDNQKQLFDDASARLFSQRAQKMLNDSDYNKLSDEDKKATASKVLSQSREDVLSAMNIPKTKRTKSGTIKSYR